jgi:isocitrate/isopropylmalate dehydrogenase
MNNLLSTQELLQQMAHIQRMEPGKLCVIREGPEGPYYNLQCRENGKTLTFYIPRDQAEQVAMHTANHQRFQELVNQYAQQIIDQTRAERLAGVKKKNHHPHSFWRKKKKSSS